METLIIILGIIIEEVGGI